MTKLRLGLVVGGVAVGLAAFNRRLERSGGSGGGIGGETRRWRWRGEELAYSVAGEGEPLLLVHGIYAGASSFEFRKNFAELAKSFRVYALDLFGCGFSDRPRRRYGPEDVTAQIEDFVREGIRTPAHLIASSLSATLVMPSAVRSPRLFRKLVLICPTGYSTLNRPSRLRGELTYALFRTPIVGDSLYHAIVSRRGIRYYLRNLAYHDPSFVTGELVESYYRTAHGPGARYLPAAFVSGRLNLSVEDHWPRVLHRTLLCWGEEARTTPVRDLEVFLRRNPRAGSRVFGEAALLPHDERHEAFNREALAFLSDGTRA